MRSGTVVARLSIVVSSAVLALSACAGSEESGQIPGWPEAERMTYTLVTDCETVNPEEFCGAFIELMANGYGGYLPGGDVIDGIEWEYKTSDVIELRLEDSGNEDDVISEFLVVGSELHEVGTNRVFVSSPEEEEAVIE